MAGYRRRINGGGRCVMTVYVDDAFIPARVGRINAKWCHLTADTIAELNEFASSIGLRRTWFQNKPVGRWHYDVTESLRAKAIMRGAVQTTWQHATDIYTRPDREGRDGVKPTTLPVCSLPVDHAGGCDRPQSAVTS